MSKNERKKMKLENNNNYNIKKILSDLKSEKNFALSNLQAEANADGSYTFHFEETGANCPADAVNVLDVQPDWTAVFRMYKPKDVEEIVLYTKALLENPVKTIEQ